MKDEIKSANVKLINALNAQYAANDIADHIVSNYIADKPSKAKKKKHKTSETLKTIAETFAIFGIYKNDLYCGYVELSDKDTGFELGIDILPEFQKQGIGTEAIIAFCDEIYKEYDIQKINLRIMASNTASIRFFEKLGAGYERDKPFMEGLEELLGEEKAKDFIIREYTLYLPIKQ